MRPLLLALLLALPGADAAGSPLEWKSSDGDHVVKLGVESRLRLEGWDAHAENTDWFTGVRSRASARYAWRDRVTAFLEFQDARVSRLAKESSGAGSLYRSNSGDRSNAHGDRIRQAWLEVRPADALRLRVGRQDIKLGTEVMYPEPSWRYVKVARVSQRLVGTVGWTHAERSNDGIVASLDLGDHLLYAFAARPTTGVFDIDSAYSSQDDIQYGGLTWTAKRGSLLPDTELRLFGIAYRDERSPDDGFRGSGITGESTSLSTDDESLEVYTVGFSLITICPCRGGMLDIVLWGAGQWGDWVDLDHQAWAGVFEVGYQATEVAMQPWLRAGLNVASGDSNPNDGDHETFFNMLPTNHLYYGFADQFALSNLINYFAQLKLQPLPKLGANVFLHHFLLFDDSDSNYFGTGAFNRQVFGYGARASTGHRSVGTEVDLVLDYKANEWLGFQAGYAYMWGHAQFNAMADDDVRFAYVQAVVRY